MIILLNGPPRSGKDTAAKIIQKLITGCYHYKFAKPLKKACHALLGLTPKQIELLLNDKDKPSSILRGMTLREYYIAMSETFAKEHFGERTFGYAAINALSGVAAPNVVISDCGFDDEVLALNSQRIKGNMYVILLERPGCSFANDSRRYLSKETCNKLDGCKGIINEYELEFFEEQIKRALNKWNLLPKRD